MATLDSIFIVEGGAANNLSILAGASSAAQAASGLFGIIATGDFHIKFGDSDALTDADATCIRMTSDTFCRFDMGRAHSHFKVYNPGAGAITVQWIPLSRS